MTTRLSARKATAVAAGRAAASILARAAMGMHMDLPTANCAFLVTEEMKRIAHKLAGDADALVTALDDTPQEDMTALALTTAAERTALLPLLDEGAQVSTHGHPVVVTTSSSHIVLSPGLCAVLAQCLRTTLEEAF